MPIFSFFDAISFLYSFFSLRAFYRLVTRWNAFWDAEVTSADRTLANELAIFVLIPLGVFLHEGGHALATWQMGGRVVDFQWRVFWGYIIPAGNFTPAQDWWISFSGPLVSILIGLIPLPFLPRARRNVWGELLYAFVRQEAFYALIWYPVLCFIGFDGDWTTIYNFAIAPFAQITLAAHVALLAGLWWLDRSARAARWRVGRDPHTQAALDKLEVEALAQPADPKPLLALARFYAQVKEPQQALRYERRADQLAPNAPEVLVTRALLAFGRKQYPQAQASANAALAVPLAGDDQARMHQVAAYALMKLDRRAEAVPHLDAALRLSPEHPDLYYWRAQVKRALGRPDEARLDFEQAARLAPDADRQAAARRGLEHTQIR